MELEEAKKILIDDNKTYQLNKLLNDTLNIESPKYYQAIETVLKALEEKDKEITDMKEVFIRTAKHQEKIGHEELAEYMLAQIQAVPTFTTWEEYITYVPKKVIEDKIKELNQIKNTALTDRTVEMMNDKIQVLQDLLRE